MTGDIEVFVADGERNIFAGRMYPHLRRGSESASFIWREVAVAHGLQQHDLEMMAPAFEHAEARRAWDLIEGR